MFKYAKPTIPLGLLHDIEELEPGGSYDQATEASGSPRSRRPRPSKAL